MRSSLDTSLHALLDAASVHELIITSSIEWHSRGMLARFCLAKVYVQASCAASLLTADASSSMEREVLLWQDPSKCLPSQIVGAGRLQCIEKQMYTRGTGLVSRARTRSSAALADTPLQAVLRASRKAKSGPEMTRFTFKRS
jgi:hypothetical protein